MTRVTTQPSSGMELAFGTHVLLVGVEDGPDGTLYLDHRADGIYALVDRCVWRCRGGHITMPTPPAECIYREGSPC